MAVKKPKTKSKNAKAVKPVRTKATVKKTVKKSNKPTTEIARAKSTKIKGTPSKKTKVVRKKQFLNLSQKVQRLL